MCLLFDVMYKCMMWESYPCTCLDIPLGFQEVEFPRVSIQYANKSGKVVNPTHPTHLPPPPRRYPCYSFLIQTEKIPVPQCKQKNYVNKNPNYLIRNQIRDLPARAATTNHAAVYPHV
jgi:hypothetical protein